jgi:hypothetical protein
MDPFGTFFIFHFFLLSGLFLVSLCLLSSCTKTTNVNSSGTFIKVIVHDSDFHAVNCLQLTDGNYLLTGRDILDIRAGWLVKLDTKGNIIWQKNVPAFNIVLWKAMALPGGGFMTAGFNTETSNIIYVYIYDNDGNILSSKSLTVYDYCNKYPLHIVLLNNGNYAFAGTYGYSSAVYAYLDITDNTFNSLYLNSYFIISDGDALQAGAQDLCQSEDGAINMTGWLYNINSYPNMHLIRVTPEGAQLSHTILNDSLYSQTPNCIATYKNNLIIANSRELSGSDFGGYSNWTNTGYDLLAATLCLDNIDTSAKLVSREQFTGYPPYAMFSSMKHTQDGGYVLCGTVNSLLSASSGLVSPTKIYVIKLDANLNQQWTNMYDTNYPSYGIDICQTSDGGYLICGHHRSFQNHFDMVLIKTDANGNVN